MNAVNGVRVQDAGPVARRRRRRYLAAIGVAPFLAYVGFFLIVPAASVMVEAFRDNNGGLSFSNLATVVSSKSPWLHSYALSLELSAASAVLAGILGLVGTVALVSSPNRIVRRLVTTACGVLANTGGVPLAFAFIATIGNAASRRTSFRRSDSIPTTTGFRCTRSRDSWSSISISYCRS